jgi:hypothetical protein
MKTYINPSPQGVTQYLLQQVIQSAKAQAAFAPTGLSTKEVAEWLHSQERNPLLASED